MRIAGEYASWAGVVTLTPNAPDATPEILRADLPRPTTWAIAIWATGITSGGVEVIVRPWSGRGVDDVVIPVFVQGLNTFFLPAREISVSARWSILQPSDVRVCASVAPLCSSHA